MILVLLVGAAAGWAAHRIRTQRRAVAAVRAAGGSVRYDFRDQVAATDARGMPIHREEPSAPAWLRRRLGDERFRHVVGVSLGPASPDLLASVARFDRLDELALYGPDGVGTGFRSLRDLRHLRDLHVAGAVAAADTVLADVAALPALDRLRIVMLPATDAGFAHLAQHRNIADLGIDACPHLTDAGAARMVAGLPRLRRLGFFAQPWAPTATLRAVARHHPDLEVLDLQGMDIAEEDLRPLEGMTKPRTVGFNLAPPAAAAAAPPSTSPAGPR